MTVVDKKNHYQRDIPYKNWLVKVSSDSRREISLSMEENYGSLCN